MFSTRTFKRYPFRNNVQQFCKNLPSVETTKKKTKDIKNIEVVPQASIHANHAITESKSSKHGKPGEAGGFVLNDVCHSNLPCSHQCGGL
ncbi:hypothetical protein DKX38_000142 [Salix brachista]|uniref:Uncharacterized protein n=1 Tax=Salix brachista TaxID=2182728 RepID=A0A5N5P1G6_9ROSI|nr:hypothetical protein DKX38_000142 [Salix brachista]